MLSTPTLHSAPARSTPRRVAAEGRRCSPTWWLVAPALLFIAARYLFAPTDVDYWWHVRTGQLILETGLPRADVFSGPSAGQPWITHEWLTQAIFFLVERSVGYVGNVVLWGAAGAGVWCAVYATARARGLGEPAAALLALTGAAMGVSIAAVRPQVLTALLLAITTLLVTRAKRGHDRALWWLPPLFLIWVNLHGGYVIGLVLLGLAIVGETTSHLMRRPSAALRPLVTTAVLSGLATLVSPNGLEALWYPFTYAGTGNASMRFIAEWQSPNFHETGFLVFGGSLLLAALLGMGRRPLGVTEALWTVLFSFMALSSLRHIPLYAIIVLPLIGSRLAAEFSWLARPLAEWRRPALAAAAWPIVIAAIIALAVRAETTVGAQSSRSPSGYDYPSGAVQYLREHPPAGPLFNEYHWGGYLIYHLYPEIPVFIDGRADVHGDTFMSQYVKVARLQPGWRDVLNAHGVQLMLVQRSTPLDVVLSDDPQWQLLFAGEVERLYGLVHPPVAARARALDV